MKYSVHFQLMYYAVTNYVLYGCNYNAMCMGGNMMGLK